MVKFAISSFLSGMMSPGFLPGQKVQGSRLAAPHKRPDDFLRTFSLVTALSSPFMGCPILTNPPTPPLVTPSREPRQGSSFLSHGSPTRWVDRKVLEDIGRMSPEMRETPLRPEWITGWSHDNARSALSQILSRHLPQILAFGEIHSLINYQGLTDIRIFSRDLLPLLARAGYTDIIYEGLPGDVEDIIHDHTAMNPYWNNLAVHEPHRLEEAQDLLHLCRENGITPQGGGITSEEMIRFYRQEPYLNRGMLLYFVGLVQQHTLQRARILAAQGRRIVCYGGAGHVPPYLDFFSRNADWDEFSYGDDLVQDGRDYRGVTLILPSYIAFMIDAAPVIHDIGEGAYTSTLWFLHQHGLIPSRNHVNLLEINHPQAPSNAQMSYLVFPFEP